MPAKYRIMPVKKFGLSVDEKTYQAAKEVVESGAYRNMSHLFEEGAKRIIQEELTKKSQVNPYEALASL
ncbi:MAG: hypothetical protein STSR0001_09420 [Methanothrix sp.]